MENSFKIRFFHDLHILERKVKLVPPLYSAGFLVDKTKWELRNFDSFIAFSFILKGEGIYKRFGKKWLIKAPCVLTQWPGDVIEYGPNKKWEEVFFAYSKEHLFYFRDSGLMDDQNPLWNIQQQEYFHDNFTELIQRCESAFMDEEVDAIDLLAIKMLGDSKINVKSTFHNQMNDIIALRRQIDNDLSLNLETREMADKLGMSLSTFRRQWLKYIGSSPQQYIIQKKLDLACRLLRESDMTIQDIAMSLHFKDHFYFSRLFKSKTSISARDYRKKYRNQR